MADLKEELTAKERQLLGDGFCLDTEAQRKVLRIVDRQTARIVQLEAELALARARLEAEHARKLETVAGSIEGMLGVLAWRAGSVVAMMDPKHPSLTLRFSERDVPLLFTRLLAEGRGVELDSELSDLAVSWAISFSDVAPSWESFFGSASPAEVLLRVQAQIDRLEVMELRVVAEGWLGQDEVMMIGAPSFARKLLRALDALAVVWGDEKEAKDVSRFYGDLRRQDAGIESHYEVEYLDQVNEGREVWCNDGDDYTLEQARVFAAAQAPRVNEGRMRVVRVDREVVAEFSSSGEIES